MQFGWSYTFGLFADPDFWWATLIVVELSVLAWASATVIGFFLALGKRSQRRYLRWPATLYVWFFRSIPLLVLLIFVYNVPQAIPEASVVLSSPFAAGLLAMILSESAYIAEIHRGGLMSVPPGQVEAGRALALPFVTIQQKIVIPQAIRIALPTLGNQYVTIVKLTSLVSVISLAEILFVGQQLYTSNFKVLETMFAVAVYYVLIVTVADNALNWLERRLDVRHGRRRRRPDLAAGAASAAPGLTNYTGARQPTGQANDRRPILEIKELDKSFGDTRVLSGISLDIQRGEVLAVIGPSGSGKTTLIRTLNGLEMPDQGAIRMNGDPLFERAENQSARSATAASRSQVRHIGMVFQEFNLFPHKTVLANVELAPRYHRLSSASNVRRDALALLAKVGLSEHAMKYPHELSGGQKQRVAIARALAMQPAVLLFDEPTSALDPELVGEVLSVIEDLAREGFTMLIVTHEMQFARRISDRVIFMDEGEIIDEGPPETLFTRARDSRIGSFLRHVTTH